MDIEKIAKKIISSIEQRMTFTYQPSHNNMIMNHAFIISGMIFEKNIDRYIKDTKTNVSYTIKEIERRQLGKGRRVSDLFMEPKNNSLMVVQEFIVENVSPELPEILKKQGWKEE